MGGLNHDFLLLSLEEYSYWDYSKFYNSPQAIMLHDEIIHYVSDSLKWMPCHVPVRKNKLYEHKGLDLYGVTIIKEEGAEKAHQIFSLWADLFSHSPKVLKLTGHFSWNQEEGAGKGTYETIMAERDKVVRACKQIAEYAKKVMEGEGRLYILHIGI